MFRIGKSTRLVSLLVVVALLVVGTGVQKSNASGPVNCLGDSKSDSGCSKLEGSNANSILPSVLGATISGGGAPAFPNQVMRDFGTIGGGLANQAAERATVGGGAQNTASGLRSTISGGFDNLASGENASIGGGWGNIASDIQANVSGGLNNTASAWDSTIGGGSGNVASYHLSTIGGGSYNKATSLNTTVGGGDSNTSSGAYSAIGGGQGNRASGMSAVIAGGAGNEASGDNSTVGGGLVNRASGDSAVVGGGANNTASGPFSVIPGGSYNEAAGAYSFAAGRHAIIKTGHDGSFLFSDSNGTEFDSVAANEFAVRATGGVRFVTAVDSSGGPASGVRLASGSGSWESLSDRNAKSNLAPVDTRGVLEQILAMPISTWNYTTEDASVQHMGPMAQDFSRLGVGRDDKHIASVDAEGAALAAIQGLYQVVQDKDRRITAQDQEIADLKKQVAHQQSELESVKAGLAKLEQGGGSNGVSSTWPVEASPIAALLAGACLVGLVWSRTKREIG